MQALMGQMLGIDVGAASLLTAGLGYAGKRDALLSLLQHSTLPPNQIEKIRWHLGNLHKHNQLRNQIAHSLWGKGKRPDAIKPHYVIVRSGAGKFYGVDPNERDYTSDEIARIGDELVENYDRFLDFLSANCLVPSIDS
jgi:hypothetical protein